MVRAVVESPVRIARPDGQSRPVGHPGGHRHHLFVALHEIDQGVGVGCGEGAPPGLQLGPAADHLQLGTRIVAVTPGKTETHGLAGLVSTIRPLSLEDARHMAQLPHVDAIVPLVQGTAKIEAGRLDFERVRSSAAQDYFMMQGEELEDEAA